MLDRDIEDTRQPKESAQYARCDDCDGQFIADDLIPYDDLWMCSDCFYIRMEEEYGRDNI